MAIDHSDSRAKGVQCADALVRLTRAVIEIPGILLQSLPKNNRILPECGCLIGIGRDTAESADRAIHEIGGQFLRAASPGRKVCIVEWTTVNPHRSNIIPKQTIRVSLLQIGI